MPMTALLVLFLVLLVISPAAGHENLSPSGDRCPSKIKPDAPCAVHVVKKGDILTAIAVHYRSEGQDIKWREILDVPANRFILERKVPFHRLGKKSKIRKPEDYLLPGDKITLPRFAKVLAETHPPPVAALPETTPQVTKPPPDPAPRETKEETKVAQNLPAPGASGGAIPITGWGSSKIMNLFGGNDKGSSSSKGLLVLFFLTIGLGLLGCSIFLVLYVILNRRRSRIFGRGTRGTW